MGTNLLKHFSILALLSTLLVLHVEEASAATLAANTQIVNTATLTYNDGTTTKTTGATVIVKYALVQTNPTIALGPNGNTPYNGPGTTLHNTFIVTNNSNGPESYTFETAITGTPTNTSGPTATVISPTGSTTLGATITVSGSTITKLVVPSDGSITDSAINGITVGSKIAINGSTGYTVDSIDDQATGNSSITFSPALGVAPGSGVQVGNYITVTVDVTAGTITTVGQDVVVTKNLKATWPVPGGGTGSLTTPGSVTDTFTSGTATLQKFVRNTTTNQVGTTKLTHNTTDYYQQGITAKANEVLEYILVATNSGTGPVTASVITDQLPISYVTFDSGFYPGGKDIAYENNLGAFTYLGQSSSDGDQGKYDSGSGLLTVNVGTAATSSAGGSIPASSTVYVYYRVKVNP